MGAGTGQFGTALLPWRPEQRRISPKPVALTSDRLSGGPPDSLSSGGRSLNASDLRIPARFNPARFEDRGTLARFRLPLGMDALLAFSAAPAVPTCKRARVPRSANNLEMRRPARHLVFPILAMKRPEHLSLDGTE